MFNLIVGAAADLEARDKKLSSKVLLHLQGRFRSFTLSEIDSIQLAFEMTSLMAELLSSLSHNLLFLHY